MNKLSKIYIAGHEGLIGSALLNKLKNEGYKNLIYFDHSDLDLLDKNSVDTMFKLYKPKYVFLTAAKNGGFYSNNLKPGEYIYENIMIQTNIIEASRKFDVKKLIFLCSSNVYPKNVTQPIKEEFLFNGQLDSATSAYSMAKLAGIEMCKAYKKQYGSNFITAITCNVYGENDNFSLTDGQVIPIFIHKFYNAKINNISQVEVYGDGCSKREFIHSYDLADALLFLMKNYDSSVPINIGTNIDVSISFLAKMIKDITGFKGEIIWNRNLPTGINKKLLDSSNIKNLGWEPSIKLDAGIIQTYDWFIKNYNTLRK